MKNSKEELDKKFLSSGQERLRLEIALIRFFQVQPLEEIYEKYRSYLSRRFRPAMEQLIKERDTEKAQQIFQLIQVNMVQMDELLGMAQKYGHTEMFVWLLSEKEKRFGFKRKEMEL